MQRSVRKRKRQVLGGQGWGTEMEGGCSRGMMWGGVGTEMQKQLGPKGRTLLVQLKSFDL